MCVLPINTRAQAAQECALTSRLTQPRSRRYPAAPRLWAKSDFGRAVSRILSALEASRGENHLSQQPVPGTRSAVRNPERAAPRSPIWPCTRWGFPCLRACAWSGGLLLHLFTLTLRRFQISNLRFERPESAVCFLWHYPSGGLAASPPACILHRAVIDCLSRLRGIAPFGVRTFLPPEWPRGSDPPPFQNHSQYTGAGRG